MKTTQATLAMTVATACCLLVAMDAIAQRPGGRPSPAQWIERLDKDHDGKVSETEFDGPAEHFSHFDQNGDGFVEECEVPENPPPREHRRGGRSDDQTSETEGRRGPPIGEHFITMQDKDGDNRVSHDEFRGPAEHFDHFDQDQDGYITLEEAPTRPPPGHRRHSDQSNREKPVS